MTMVKICGLTEEEGLDAAIESGADMIGFVFYPKSPRYVTPERAAELLDGLPPDIFDDLRIVGLFVDPTDADLEQVFRILRPDIIQFHGSETPERIEAIRLDFAVEAIKAIGVSSAEDLKAAEAYLSVADYLLFDAKPPKDADRPGGHGVAFDWTLMQQWTHDIPWLLAGGLTPETVDDAIRLSGAPGVDVSSGVESAPGVKDPEKIAAFFKAVDG
ncbi:phosphoribosylanthranilate isomerase [Insolitispirillum peregrinum]|uniref:N-(5'-phosphoribosyl)anthranilate isomerase n=1 Tax=Insolitispirillum peregrinum TaxID=80876 RepID=A0A1N7JW92_9PROT|nr:phosphoribosylanthranilate isomerase [Insolitispirillum peregrinum]